MSTPKVKKFRDIQVLELPRERLFQKGSHALSLRELLSIVISSGNGHINLNTVIDNIFERFPTLNSLQKADVDELIAIAGIGKAKACQIVACFELSRRSRGKISDFQGTVYDKPGKFKSLLNPYLLHKTKEYFVVCSLDSRFRLIGIDYVSMGTVNEALVHPREIFKIAMNKQASYIVIAHNHPSGDFTPSKEDVIVTRKLIEVSRVVGIPLIDHIIFSDNGYLSLKDVGHI